MGARAVIVSIMGLSALFASAPARSGDYAVEPLALVGDVVQGTFGQPLVDFGEVTVNNHGDAAFVATTGGGSVPRGIFLASGGTVSLLVGAGQIVPVTGGSFSTFQTPAIDDDGDVAFFANITGSPVTRGVFLYSGGVITPIAVYGGPAPVPGGGSYLGFGGLISRDDAGHTLFFATVSSAPFPRGLFLDTNGVQTAVALYGETAPGTGGAPYTTFVEQEIVDDSGDVVFISEVGGSLMDSAFLASGGTDSAVLLVGDPAPDGVGVVNDVGAVSIDSAGDVRVLASVSGGSAPHGIFLVPSSGPGSALVLTSTPAPGVGTGTMVSLEMARGMADVDDFSTLVYRATLVGGSSSLGLFAKTPDDDLTVALTGEVAPGTGGATFTNFSSVGANESGEAAFLGSLSGASEGIFLARPPLAMGSLAGLAGDPPLYVEDFDGETAYPTAPEVDLAGYGGMTTELVGNGPPAAPTFLTGALQFSVGDAAGALPFEYAAVGLATANLSGFRDVGFAGRFRELAMTGPAQTAVGVSATTVGGTAYRAQLSSASGGTLQVIESVAGSGSVLNQTDVVVGSLPSGEFILELLLDRGAGTAKGLLRTASGDVLTSDLAVTAAIGEDIPIFGPLAYVLNGATGQIDVELHDWAVYGVQPVPSGDAAWLSLALGCVGAGGIAAARRRRF